MQCPAEIAEILGEILRIGLLRIRVLGWNQDPDRCAIEADHLHNLPVLLSDYKPGLLDYYWTAERTAFMEQSSREDISQFEPLWQALANHLGHDEVVSAKS